MNILKITTIWTPFEAYVIATVSPANWHDLVGPSQQLYVLTGASTELYEIAGPSEQLYVLRGCDE